MLRLREVQAEGEDLHTFRDLLSEYQSFLGLDLCFQGFEYELKSPLGKYGPPTGRILLAELDGQTVACGALQNLGEGVCELKRIFVRPNFRRQGIARGVSVRLIEDGRALGYRTARLDTLRRLPGALELYRSLGFTETRPYNFNPESDIVYLERQL